jgi:hypothetical protein
MIGRSIFLYFTWILLAAHFSRANSTLLMIVCLAAPLILLIKKRWALISIQIATLAGAGVWLLTTYQLIKTRVALGEDWARMAIILISVSLITAIAGILIGSGKNKERYL